MMSGADKDDNSFPDEAWLAGQVEEMMAERAGDRFQGLIVPDITVQQAAFDSADRMVLADSVASFANLAARKAWLVPGEYPLNAFRTSSLGFYVAQVGNGGHGQWAANSGWDLKVVWGAGSALRRMGAAEHVALFDRFFAIMNDDDTARAQAIFDGGGFGDIDPEVAEIDAAFHALERRDSAWPRWGAYLKTALDVRPRSVDSEALQRELEARNPLRDLRKAGFEEHEKAERANEPTHRVARELCAQAGLAFIELLSGAPLPAALSGGDGFFWRVETDKGGAGLNFVRYKRLFGFDYQAMLVRDRRVLASKTLSKEAFHQIVPVQALDPKIGR